MGPRHPCSPLPDTLFPAPTVFRSPAALLVDELDAIGIAIEGDSDIGSVLQDGLGQHLRVHRPTLLVDVAAVRFDADRYDIGPQFPEYGGCGLVGGAVGEIGRAHVRTPVTHALPGCRFSLENK